MVTIQIEPLRRSAERIRKEAIHHRHCVIETELCISWMQRQEFKEKEELYRTLMKQCEEIRMQERELIILSETLARISSRYENTEEKIQESGESVIRMRGEIASVDLDHLRKWLDQLGIHR